MTKIARSDLLHVDVMDGHFVPNISYGAPVLSCLHAALPEVYYDVHLMISDQARYAADFAKAGANLITFHLEAVPQTPDTLLGCGPGSDPGHERGTRLWRAECRDRPPVCTGRGGLAGGRRLPVPVPRTRRL